MAKLVIWAKPTATSRVTGSSAIKSKISALACNMPPAISPRNRLFQSAWRTTWGIWSSSLAPTWCATSGLTDIMMPMRVMMTMFQTDTPSDTPAKSCAEAWPAMATSATDMPIFASCPTMMGQASSHSARISARNGVLPGVNAGGVRRLDMEAGFYGWGGAALPARGQGPGRVAQHFAMQMGCPLSQNRCF